jgi:hypothetical protein
MCIAGSEILSLPTERASRTLMLTASLVILIEYNNLTLTDMQPFGLKLTASVYEAVVIALISCCVITLLIWWVGDLVAYCKWAKENVIVQIHGHGAFTQAHGQYMRGSATDVVEALRSAKNQLSEEK